MRQEGAAAPSRWGKVNEHAGLAKHASRLEDSPHRSSRPAQNLAKREIIAPHKAELEQAYQNESLAGARFSSEPRMRATATSRGSRPAAGNHRSSWDMAAR